ncbi:hypothetical protein KCU78_g9758, partial [Aureobasidium melanogenum]
MFEKARACLRSIENNGKKVQRKAGVQVEAQQSIVNDTQDRSVERCSIDDDQVTQLNTESDKMSTSAIASKDMENSEDEIYDSTEDWRKAIFDKLHNMEYTMYGIKEKTDMTLHTMERSRVP